MAKKRGYCKKVLRSKRGIYMMNQVYEREHKLKKLAFLQVIDILGIGILILTPLALIALFFISLLAS